MSSVKCLNAKMQYKIVQTVHMLLVITHFHVLSFGEVTCEVWFKIDIWWKEFLF